jgi:hypothetical protein
VTVETLRTAIREVAVLAAVIMVGVLTYHGSISGDAGAAILGGVAGASITGAVSSHAVKVAQNGSGS